MPSTAVSDLVECVASKQEAGMCKSKVGAEFVDDFPDVVEPVGQAAYGLGDELFSARAFLDE